MRIEQIFRLIVAVIAAIVVGLSSYLFIQDWRAYDSARRCTPLLVAFRATLLAAEKVSAERGPSNAVLGADKPRTEELWRELELARARSDQTLAAAIDAVRNNDCLSCSRAKANLESMRNQLQMARAEIDRLAVLPRGERTTKSVREAIVGMFALASDTILVSDHMLSELIRREPSTADHMLTARLAAELREYAGRAGSDFTPALINRRALQPEELRQLWLDVGRVLELGNLIEARTVKLLPENPRLTQAIENLNAIFFGSGISYLERIAALESDSTLMPSTSMFARVYVPMMRPILVVRDLELDIAEQRLSARVGEAGRHLALLAGGLGLVAILIALGIVLFSRRILQPLACATGVIAELAAGGYDMPVPSSRPDDQIGAMLVALERLRGELIRKEELEADRSELIGRLSEAAERAREQAEHLGRARDAAEVSLRAKDSFLAMMSHEIRTPMSGVLGLLELLQQDPLSAEQQEMLAIANHSGRVLLQILDDILDYAKIDAGRLAIVISPVDLRQLVREVAGLFSAKADEKGVALTVDIDSTLAPMLLTDPVRVRQILFNLLSNAIKFTLQGRVGIHVEVEGGSPGRQKLSITVVDTGIGIEPSAQRRLFNPFEQAEDMSTRRFGGTGLGLSICKRLADLMEGRLTLESVKGIGTSVTLQLELAISPQYEGGWQAGDVDVQNGDRVSAPFALPASFKPIGSGRRIVVAEDEPINSLLLNRQLHQLGYYNVEMCNDGVQAWEALSREPAALLITDVHMPGMGGMALVQRIRASESSKGGHLPILVITASTLNAETQRWYEAGIDGLLAKPTTLTLLRETVGRLLGGEVGEPIGQG